MFSHTDNSQEETELTCSATWITVRERESMCSATWITVRKKRISIWLTIDSRQRDTEEGSRVLSAPTFLPRYSSVTFFCPQLKLFHALPLPPPLPQHIGCISPEVSSLQPGRQAAKRDRPGTQNSRKYFRSNVVSGDLGVERDAEALNVIHRLSVIQKLNLTRRMNVMCIHTDGRFY
jgi:hypothetical protein